MKTWLFLLVVLTASVAKAQQERPANFATKEKATPVQNRACEFPNLKLPADYLVYAAGAYSGRPVGFQIDQSGHEATQIDVEVNHPAKPVVLMLGAYTAMETKAVSAEALTWGAKTKEEADATIEYWAIGVLRWLRTNKQRVK